MLVYVCDRFLRNYIWSLQPRQPGHQQFGSDTVFTVTVVIVFSGRGRHLLPAGRKYEVGPLLQRCEAAVATRLRKSGGSRSLIRELVAKLSYDLERFHEVSAGH